MNIAEVVTSWTTQDFGEGMVGNAPSVTHHQIESYTDTTAQDSGKLLPGHLVIVQVQAREQVMNEIRRCPDCHVLWDESPSRTEGRLELLSPAALDELQLFLPGGELHGVAADMTHRNAASLLKTAFRQQ